MKVLAVAVFLAGIGGTFGAVAGDDPVEVGVSVLSRFRPALVRVEGGREIQAVAEDGSRRAIIASDIEIRCGGKDPLVLVAGRERVAAGAVEIRGGSLTDLRVKVPGAKARRYLGWLEVREREGRCLVLDHLPFESYIAAAACAEIRGAGPEALRAQTVLSRTYARAHLGKHAAEGFDFCDLTHCQVFEGAGACTAQQRLVQQAADSLYLLYQGQPAEAVYFSTCAGETADAADIWGDSMVRPYLSGVADGKPAYCAGSDHSAWRLEMGAEELCRELHLALPALGKGPCTITLEPGKGGWVRRVHLRGGGSVDLRGEEFHLLLGKRLGWNRFKSARFTVEERGGRFLFLGKGMGHGVGMCQQGAMGMERSGFDFRGILDHYFPGTAVGRWP